MAPLLRILVVEDEPRIARYLQTGLEQEGHTVQVVGNGAVALKKVLKSVYDLVLLDWLLPDMDGLTLCRTAREHGVRTPVIMLTARDATVFKVLGLDGGADDYVTKPFEFEELLARIRAVLRRSAAGAAPLLKFADVVVDPAAHTVTRAGRVIELTAKEFSLLEYLVRHAGEAVTREELLQHVWGLDHNPRTNVVDVYIGYLRRKIDRDFATPILHTVVGVGYKLEA